LLQFNPIILFETPPEIMGEYKIHSFEEITEEKVGWLWKPYIPFGKITVIQGDPGNGKTTLALAIAALISTRRHMPTGGTPSFTGNVIYQSGEDSPHDTIKPRLMACGADCSKISFIEADGSLSPNMLEEAIVGTGAKYVVLDPLQAFLTENQDISSTKNMRPILRELGSIAARTGAAIVMIGHMNKVERSKSIYRGLGSIDITAAARSVLLVGKRKSDPDTRFMTQIKNNLSVFGKAIGFTIGAGGGVEFLGEYDIAEEDLLSDTLAKQSKYELATELILSMLAVEDKKSNEIYDACMNAGISSSTMQHIKKKLGIKSIRKIDDWYWTRESEAVGCDHDDLPNPEPDSDTDETPVMFLDDAKNRVPEELFKPSVVTMPSPFGELRLIDWRVSV